jgi:hypothetical protein
VDHSPYRYFPVSPTRLRSELRTSLPTVEQELFTPPEHLSSPSVISGVRITCSLVLGVCFVDRYLSFFFWPLCCLSFDLRILINLLVSSNSSCYFTQFRWLFCCGHYIEILSLIQLTFISCYYFLHKYTDYYKSCILSLHISTLTC